VDQNTNNTFEVEMLIKTNEQWEIKDHPIKFFDSPGTRIYPLIELSLNSHLFHVDILPKPSGSDDVALWHRFITADLEQAFVIVEEDLIDEFNISIQTRRCDNEDHDYKINTILEILTGKETAGQTSYVFICKNGKRIIDSAMGESEDDLKDLKVIYKNGQKPSSLKPNKKSNVIPIK
jgi:hypothetical protein